eukprot:1109911-Prorocentrum_minimum.AAC.1
MTVAQQVHNPEEADCVLSFRPDRLGKRPALPARRSRTPAAPHPRTRRLIKPAHPQPRTRAPGAPHPRIRRLVEPASARAGTGFDARARVCGCEYAGANRRPRV